jgi:hypothetical protein
MMWGDSRKFFTTNREKRPESANATSSSFGASQRLPEVSLSPITSAVRRSPPVGRWERDALRHSFCSYRLADVKSVAQVALEAGNSPQMIFEHYRELVTEKSAKAWFAITPEAAKALKAKLDQEREAKIVKFPATAAA